MSQKLVYAPWLSAIRLWIKSVTRDKPAPRTDRMRARVGRAPSRGAAGVTAAGLGRWLGMISCERSHPLSASQRTETSRHASVVALRVHRRLARFALCLCALVLLFAARSAGAADMVRNGGFAVGQDGRPAEWETEQWSSTAGTTFEWR